MNVWVEAARPRTLSAAVAPVIVGTAATGRVIAWRFAAALVVGVAIQIAVNFANDLFDAARGVDTEDRVGPRRATASGLVTPRAMKIATGLALLVAGVAGGWLALTVGPELWVVGALSFVAALGYSGGPRPYASAALGELFVFLFFGLVATIGSAYVQVERVVDVAVAASVPIGLLAVAILVANNLRDIATDERAGKRTLAVRLGDSRTRGLYGGAIAAALVSTAVVAVVASDPRPLMALGAAPLAVPAIRMVTSGASGAALLPVLGATARLQIAYAILLTVGLWISS